MKVQKVLLDLDMQPIRDNQAKKLSGGQKRRLSVAIAVLGNPKVRVSRGSAFVHEDVKPFGGGKSCAFWCLCEMQSWEVLRYFPCAAD